MKEQVLTRFKELFGDEGDIRVYFAPGRVNLIGEHTDYNGGHVFPCALTIGTYGVARKRADKKLRFYSMNFEQLGVLESSIEGLKPEKEADWTNYPKGVIWAFGEKGMQVDTGLDLLLFGNIPNGSGLSSSASVEVLTGYILKDLFGFDVTNQDLALIGQFSENKFNGVNCGIMDQFASAMGREGHAIFLDCKDLSYKYVPLDMKGYKIVIGNTKKKRSLAESKYNERCEECAKALEQLRQIKPEATCLRDFAVEEFEENKLLIKDDVCRMRAEHVIYECDRVLKSVEALTSGDLEEFGKLMTGSHISLRDLYEVTGMHLDTMVEESLKIEGCIGSRMTGAGFGGCTVSIVKDDVLDTFISQVKEKYTSRTGITPEFYISEPSDGGREIKL